MKIKFVIIIISSIVFTSCSSLSNLITDLERGVQNKYSTNVNASESGLSMDDYASNVRYYYSTNDKYSARKLKQTYPSLHNEYQKQYRFIIDAEKISGKKVQPEYKRIFEWYNSL
ncbi:MAG: hypothetical protein K8H86_08915 [Ignavibacteriaceae bacterium]|nr:hypothetical protein [Ignavibacteriaceae bacterium]